MPVLCPPLRLKGDSILSALLNLPHRMSPGFSRWTCRLLEGVAGA